MGLVIKSSKACTDTSLPFAERDALVAGTNGGVHLFDLSRAYGYPRQTDPLSGDVVRDLARDQQNNTIIKRPTANLLYSGGGIDFNSTQTKPNGVAMPLSVVADIYAGGHGWLVSGVFKLPSLANWPSVPGSLTPILSTETGLQYIAAIYLVNSSGNPEIWIRRQTGAATYADRQLSGSSVHVGNIVQMSVWRTATEFGYLINSPVGRILYTAAPGAENYGDFGAIKPVFGLGGGVSDATGIAFKHKVYRGFIEDLTVTGRNPVDVADADWLRNGALGIYS